MISIEGVQNNASSIVIPTYLSIINFLSNIKKEIIPMSIDKIKNINVTLVMLKELNLIFISDTTYF